MTGPKGSKNFADWHGVRQGHCLSLILYKLITEYFTKVTIEGFEDFRVRPGNRLLLLAKAVMVLQGMIHRLNETERCSGIEMNGGEEE